MNEPELFEASGSGDIAAVKALLAAGAQVDCASPSGETALMRAASNGRLDVVRLLLNAGADVNALRADGMTPLIYAAFFGHADVVQFLVDNGADLNARDRLGMTALDWAKSKGATDAASILRRAASSESRPPVPFQSAVHEIESEEILDLPEAGAETTYDGLTEGMLDLSGEGPQEHTRYLPPPQPDVNASAAETAESTGNRIDGGGELENADHSAPATAATFIQAGDEDPPHRYGIPEEGVRRVDASTSSAVAHQVPATDKPNIEHRTSANSECESENGVAYGALGKFFSQIQPPTSFQLVCLSLTLMIGSAALTWIIFRRDESQPAKSGSEVVSPPSPGETPQAPQKSDDDMALAAALNGWLEATRARDVEKQMSFYAPGLRAYYLKRYVPSSVVRADKAELFGRARRVEISADEPEISYGKNAPTASMRFRKSYSIESDAGGRSGEVIQELVWRKTKDGWKIISERDVTVVR